MSDLVKNMQKYIEKPSIFDIRDGVLYDFSKEFKAFFAENLTNDYNPKIFGDSYSKLSKEERISRLTDILKERFENAENLKFYFHVLDDLNCTICLENPDLHIEKIAVLPRFYDDHNAPYFRLDPSFGICYQMTKSQLLSSEFQNRSHRGDRISLTDVQSEEELQSVAEQWVLPVIDHIKHFIEKETHSRSPIRYMLTSQHMLQAPNLKSGVIIGTSCCGEKKRGKIKYFINYEQKILNPSKIEDIIKAEMPDIDIVHSMQELRKKYSHK